MILQHRDKITENGSEFINIAALLCLVLSIPILFGIIENISLLNIETYDNKAFFILLSFVVCYILYRIISFLFFIIDTVTEKKQYIIKCIFLLLIGIILVYFSLKWQIKPSSDSFDDIDEAYYLFTQGAVSENNVHIGTIGIFGNNYLLIIFFKNCINILSNFGIQNIIKAFYVLNDICIIAATYFTWLIVKKFSNIKAANKTLVLCFFNPVYYALVYWFYSCTLSLPIMMAIFYVGLMLLKNSSIIKAILLALIEGLLLSIGFEIRPTSVFPFIAICICGLFICRDIGKIKYKVNILIIIAITLIIGLIFIKQVKNIYFSQISDENYPVTHWLVIGSHGNGDLSTSYSEDVQYITSFKDATSKLKAGWQRTISYYKENGVAGTINLWCRKIITTWSDGYSSIDRRLENGRTEGKLFQYFAGSRIQIFNLYCQSFRLLTIVFFIWFCARIILKHDINCLVYDVSLVTVLGGIVFYILWEAKNVYSVPFILPLLILEQDGICTFNQTIKTIEKRNISSVIFYNKSAMSKLLIALTCIILLNLYSVLRSDATYVDYRIRSLNNYRINSIISPSGFKQLKQTFNLKSNTHFNTISLLASLEDNKDISEYKVTLINNQGKKVYESTIHKDDIKNDLITLSFNETAGCDEYTLLISKIQQDKGDIFFYTKYTYYLDLYEGELTTNLKDKYTSDLMMDISLIHKDAYMPLKYVNILLAMNIILILVDNIYTKSHK